MLNSGQLAPQGPPMSQSQDTLIIKDHFCGPPNSGNGGYVCGLLGNYIDGVSQVALRQPPPLNQPLQVKVEETQVILANQNGVVAQGRPAELDLKPPDPPSFSTASEAAKLYSGFVDHQFPTCFVCGPEREEGQGLRIFAGPVPGKKIVAAPWIPQDDLADQDGYVKSEFLWAAMDCPGYYAINGEDHPAMVLGTMTARILDKIAVGSKAVVVGSKIDRQGRKARAVTALYSDEGKLFAYALAVWIELKS